VVREPDLEQGFATSVKLTTAAEKVNQHYASGGSRRELLQNWRKMVQIEELIQ